MKCNIVALKHRLEELEELNENEITEAQQKELDELAREYELYCEGDQDEH